jgi:hypothetical protein
MKFEQGRREGNKGLEKLKKQKKNKNKNLKKKFITKKIKIFMP